MSEACQKARFLAHYKAPLPQKFKTFMDTIRELEARNASESEAEHALLQLHVNDKDAAELLVYLLEYNKTNDKFYVGSEWFSRLLALVGPNKKAFFPNGLWPNNLLLYGWSKDRFLTSHYRGTSARKKGDSTSRMQNVWSEYLSKSKSPFLSPDGRSLLTWKEFKKNHSSKYEPLESILSKELDTEEEILKIVPAPLRQHKCTCATQTRRCLDALPEPQPLDFESAISWDDLSVDIPDGRKGKKKQKMDPIDQLRTDVDCLEARVNELERTSREQQVTINNFLLAQSDWSAHGPPYAPPPDEDALTSIHL